MSDAAATPKHDSSSTAGAGAGRTVAGRGRDVPRVILVDEHDRPIGSAGKLEAHEHGGRLHRAFSIFIFNARGEMLLQRRSSSKYHFGGLWTNACCSHPRHGQTLTTAQSARERLREEFGFDVDLAEAFAFTYRASDAASGLTEHEFDHVFLGTFDGEPRPNPEEIDGWTWIEPAALLADVQSHPERYTPWFKIALDRVLAHRKARTGP